MKAEIGEQFVGAYLKLCKKCSFVDYNVRPPGGGVKGLGELDVIGLDFDTRRAYLCEVTTHIRGLLYKSNRETVERIRSKHLRQHEYAKEYLSYFRDIRYMFWSPVVPVGYVTDRLGEIDTLQLIINEDYSKKVEELQRIAKRESFDAGNDFFRVLQILVRLRKAKQ